MAEISSKDKNTVSLIQKTKTSNHTCKICGELALYSHYGALVCPACKIFFKRYAEKQQVSQI